jgi:hypothetical protein
MIQGDGFIRMGFHPLKLFVNSYHCRLISWNKFCFSGNFDIWTVEIDVERVHPELKILARQTGLKGDIIEQ